MHRFAMPSEPLGGRRRHCRSRRHRRLAPRPARLPQAKVRLGRGCNGKAVLRPFEIALRGFIGGADGASLTLQGAGIKLRGVPGFQEAMEEQRIIGIGAFQRFLDLFSEFEVIGKAPKASVRLRDP